MKYSDADLPPEGLGQKEREKYSALLRGTTATISVTQASEILGIPKEKATMLLSLLAKKGWLKRIYYGLYIPVPVESETGDIIAEEPFVIAESLFSPCYIGGMNAANYWDLTEQIFVTITVMTQKQVRKHKQEIAGAQFVLHTLKPKYFFGLTKVWFNEVKVNVSDPSKTIVDMMLFPQFCGGTRFIVDVLKSYFQSKHKSIEMLMSYLNQADNGAAIKRMGFLVERYFPNQEVLINFCNKNITKGYSKLNPSVECTNLITKWRLWVPDSWKDSER